MKKIHELDIPSPFAAHLIAAHSLYPIIAVAAGLTIFVFENNDKLFNFNCSTPPKSIIFSRNLMRITCGKELIVVNCNTLLIEDNVIFDDEIT